MGTLLFGVHKKTQVYTMCAYDRSSNSLKLYDLEADDRQDFYTPRSVNVRTAQINNRLYLF